MSEEVLEDQIERDSFKQTVMEMLSEAVARDLDFLLCQGDTTSSDSLLAVLDGFIKQATTNVVSAGGVKLGKATLRDMLKTMPDEFVDNGLTFITNRQAKADYKDSLSDRATPFGDIHIATGADAEYQGYKIVDVPEFPNNLGGGTNETRVLLANPQNMVMGVLREIKLKLGEDIAAGQYIIVGSLRIDAKFMHEPAVVKATGIFGV